MAARPEALVPGPASIAVLRTRFREGKSALIERFRASRPTAKSAHQLVRTLARHVDSTLGALWLQSGLPATAALVAVGGYGRGELFPYSDVDVLILLPAEPDGRSEQVDDSVVQFVTACWDTGLEIGSSVRTIDECLAESARDVTVQT